MTALDFGFTVEARDGMARAGHVRTARGVIRTPAFMPVGTAATVKACMPETVRAAGADIILGNTYHLMLRPGAERVARLGGLHAFMNWPHPILTDSGGFQVMSLSSLRKITEEGVTFQSHIDGSKHAMSPERSIEIQRLLDSDIAMQLDECVALPATRDEAARAMELSLRWARRSKTAFYASEPPPGRAIFGIVQGGTDADLRRASAEGLVEIGFPGYALGGLAVGEPQAEMFATIAATTPHLPGDKPRYLMGVGKPADIVGAVARGIDMFDCVIPTRSGRNGQAFTRSGALNIRNAKFAEDKRPLDERCHCPACRAYSRAYLHHLVKAEEILGAMLMTAHNLRHYQDLTAGLRTAIRRGRLDAFVEAFEGGGADY
ncbi:tRNA guanosine(34) transglycosylase Tgt [Zavarzinia compransoris]|uniref:Queuine tRNA-ribosyltransferase n=1 Tax=Zavarzinia compransoris TaxID=1264899 RepID=A0A317DZE8_9PROT|nr:tRNA guanosine(34) transglycosylase Tgt [Zavarzinia compransoris]PWR20089.1 tRNA guanosine(34) transglycosylase Tgt [Zavarzinia compransoris]TDP44787.1 tRNA-guanine transglycosylase [Zavarzinia compransoris]